MSRGFELVHQTRIHFVFPVNGSIAVAVSDLSMPAVKENSTCVECKAIYLEFIMLINAVYIINTSSPEPSTLELSADTLFNEVILIFVHIINQNPSGVVSQNRKNGNEVGIFYLVTSFALLLKIFFTLP
jgi:hypothetical protein